MIDPTQEEKSRANEEFVIKRVKKNGFQVTKLDKNNPEKRPDYLFEKGGLSIVCEIKTVFSAGKDKNGNSVSEYDVNNIRVGECVEVTHRADDDLPNTIKDKLRKAVSQFKSLAKDLPKYRSVPYIVVLFGGGDVAGHGTFCLPPLNWYPENIFDDFPEMSAIVQPIKDRKQKESIREKTKEMEPEEIEELIQKRTKLSLPPPGYDWDALINPGASNPINEHTLRELLGEVHVVDRQ